MSYQQQTNRHAGQAGEAIIANLYAQKGCTIRDNRWCARGGELDLVIEDGASLVFCEVKTSKTHAQAVQHVTPAQQRRIFNTAQAYLAAHGFDQLTDIRFDVALVDQYGDAEIMENALMC